MNHVIRVIDLETTGFDPAVDEVIEIAVVNVCVADNKVIAVQGPTSTIVRPTKPIPPESSAVHHLIEEDFDVHPDICPSWHDARRSLKMFGDDVTVNCAHNAKFEQGWIKDSLPWICTYKCALRIWPDAPAHGNQVLRYWLKPQGLDRAKASPAHRAGPDAYVTAHLLREMLKVHTVEELIAWSSEPALLVKCHFGKYRGMKWSEIPDSYLDWVDRSDFDEDVKHTVHHHMKLRDVSCNQVEDGIF